MKQNFRKKTRRRRAGFTLIEVLLVLVILVILGSLVGIQVHNAQLRANVNAAKSQIGLFKTPIEAFNLDVGRYPSTLDDLVTPPSDLADPTKWGPNPYIDGGKIPLDPWEQSYRYEPPAEDSTEYRIWSTGRDRTDGTEDDISNQD